MGYAVYWQSEHRRHAGYGVPAVCEHPECVEEITRGVDNICGTPPEGEHGCGLFFCDRHLTYARRWRYCERCDEGKEPFGAKPDVEEWVQHVETDPSWAAWRAERNAERPRAAGGGP